MESWLRDIDGARNEAEVVRHARDFCSLVHPRDLAPLPEDLRSVHIEKGADIVATREQLARGYAQARAHPAEVEKLRELMTVLAHAAERITELRRVPR